MKRDSDVSDEAPKPSITQNSFEIKQRTMFWRENEHAIKSAGMYTKSFEEGALSGYVEVFANQTESRELFDCG